MVRNRSDWPIVDGVVLGGVLYGMDAPPFNVGLIDCGEDHYESWPRDEYDNSAAWNPVDIQFTDASGRRWHRSR